MMNQVLLLSEVYEESRHQAKKKIETLLIDSMGRGCINAGRHGESRDLVCILFEAEFCPASRRESRIGIAR